MPVETVPIESYLASFTEAGRRSVPAWLGELRESAFARFAEAGFPTTRDEDWRFTNLSALARTPFELPPPDEAPLAGSQLTGPPPVGPEVMGADPAGLRMEHALARLVFVDGRFAPGLSSRDGLPDQVTVESLKNAMESRPEEVRAHLGRYLDLGRDPFLALNTAFLEDGAYVHLPRGVVLTRPVHLLFLLTPAPAPRMAHPRNLIVVGEAAELSIVEEYVSLDSPAPVLSNTATELVAGASATVVHTMIQREQTHGYEISTLAIEQARGANVTSNSLIMGGALVRNNVHPVLRGEGGECLVNGLFIGSGEQHLDNYMLVEHVSPRASSRQMYNGILDGHAHGVFHGRIIVHKDAQRTDAKQTNRNLLLHDDAQMDTKPQLEIYADDVKCTHGATIGQIEEGALFYLRSRGISESGARRLLLEAFAGECLERIRTDAVREYAARIVSRRLAALETGQGTEPAGIGPVAANGRRREETR